MLPAGLELPPGIRLVFAKETDSTNAEALRLAARGEAGGLWIWAGAQTSGRGRAGRSWASPPGNLYASLLHRPQTDLATASQLSLLAGVACHDAVMSLGGEGRIEPAPQLKWPNDLLAGGAKIGGILLESASGAQSQDLAVAIGVGLNLAYAPSDLGRPATSLAALGIEATPAAALRALARSMQHWLQAWDAGRGFAHIRESWLKRAQPAGAAISVRHGNDLISGRFAGLDEAGSLLLETESGQRRRVTAGDVSLGAEACAS